MRYPTSGANAAALDSTQGDLLLGGAITSGRILWLRSAWFYNSHASEDAIINLQDGSSDCTVSTATVQMGGVVCPFGKFTMVDIPAPGLKFSTGCSALKDTTAGTVAIGDCGGNGYEE